jgi:hypothetical protein
VATDLTAHNLHELEVEPLEHEVVCGVGRERLVADVGRRGAARRNSSSGTSWMPGCLVWKSRQNLMALT